MRPVRLCRSWLFLEGANEDVLQRAGLSGADVLIQELEDFTPPALRPAARALAPELYAKWRQAGAVAAVRVNPLAQGGWTISPPSCAAVPISSHCRKSPNLLMSRGWMRQ